MYKVRFSTETDVNKKQKLKGIVHSKINIMSLITLMLFQTRTQIKIFLMKSESFLTLHKQQGSYHIQGPERYQKHRWNSPCNISGSTVILGSFGNTFCCAKKRLYSTILLLRVTLVPFWNVSRYMRVLHQQHHSACVVYVQIKAHSWFVVFASYNYGWTTDVIWIVLSMFLVPFCALTVVGPLRSMEGQKALEFHQKYLNLCSKDEGRSYRFGTTWGWVI